MDRERILRRIVGPHPFPNLTLTWRFTALRRVRPGKPGHGSEQGRAFELRYNPVDRQFSVRATRRLSKRRKREQVVVSKAMVTYLQSRLLPQHIARCTAASITVRR